MIHPLYIAVFKPLILVLKHCVSRFMLENTIETITTKYAINVGSKYWREFIQYKTTNISSGFRASVLWPLYFNTMQFCLKLFEESSITLSEENPIWMR